MLPEPDELLAAAHVVRLPLVTRFRGVTEREALLLHGPSGWGEFSPFLEYGDEEASAWLAAAIEAAWGDPIASSRAEVPVNATLPTVPVEQIAAVLERFGEVRTVKVKVADAAESLAHDVARVREVRRILGPAGRIRVDANGGWSVDAAERAAHALAGFDLEYLEQPCASIDELAELRERLHDWQLPIAADESVRKADDPLAVARAGAADLVVVKVQPLGGVARALRIVAEAGLPAIVSSAIDTSVGLAMGARLAAALPELDYDCGLGTAALLAADVTGEPLTPVDGRIPVRPVEPDAALLRAHAAPPERVAWWHDRLRRALGVLRVSR
ncbi:o-succinylbenzoate synthase [Protaetiibacter larvae]|uniref:o-succinylbenzoate synthase n=1 Tax=Protaetiibacter larvae TaxID=2592654 RepID=A0A5C1Y6J3_9MICO|nr:o-succinylbenzoate synthase [Protaetiibacter larvae]QEO08825.1 O-succinylbenzoate synthase [Protaetiibacter larvae]